MTDPEVGFSDRISRPNRLRIGALLGASLAIIVVAAVTMGASPSPSLGAGASNAPTASGVPVAPDKIPGPGDGLFGRGGGKLGGLHGITISAISGSTITLKTEDGWTRTITVSSSTTITKGGQAIAVGDLAVGDAIAFRQTRASDGTWTVTAIAVLEPTVAGIVTAVTADSITVAGRDGASTTIATTGSTIYRLGRAAATRADVTVGAAILARGTKTSTGAFTATSVTIKLPQVVGTVTAKTASTITVARRDGTSVTINVDADTTYRVAGNANASLADVAVGMRIAAVGPRNADGSFDAIEVRAGDGKRGLNGGPGIGPAKPGASASPDSSSNGG
jgi:hypothetical protein